MIKKYKQFLVIHIVYRIMASLFSIDSSHTLTTNTSRRLTKEQDKTITPMFFIALAFFSHAIFITLRKQSTHHMYLKNSIAKTHWFLAEHIKETAKQ